MNFLIFDNELSSLNLIPKLSSEFYHIKLITSNESVSTTMTSSSFLSIIQDDIINASVVIEHLSKHDNDPFDAVLIFNLSLLNSLPNVIKTMERLKRKVPRLFLIFVDGQLDQNLPKLLQESSKRIEWTIILCNEITSSPSTNYHVETKSNPPNHQPISASDLLDFLRDELRTKTHLHTIISLY